MFKSKEEELKKKVEKIGEALSYLISDVEGVKRSLRSLAEDVEKLKKKEVKRLVSTISGFETREDYEKLKNICSDLATKDSSFIYDFNNDEMEIYVISEDKDELHKKSMWLIKKTGIGNLKYKVEE